jgi:hypothetical protein
MASNPTRPAFKAGAECLIDDLFEGLACAPRLCPRLGFHIVIDGQSGSHILMLSSKRHDVNTLAVNSRFRLQGSTCVVTAQRVP